MAFAAITAIVIARAVSINSIYDSFILFLVLALTILLLGETCSSIVSLADVSWLYVFDIICHFLNLFPDAITKWWALKISLVYLWKIPAEEFLWAFGLRLALGPI